MILEVEKESTKKLNEALSPPKRLDGVPSIENSSVRHRP